MMIFNEWLKAIVLSGFGLIALSCLSLLFIWSALRTCKQGFSHLRQLHSVPCHRCQYFTGDHRLKCAAQPIIACIDAAIDCDDFAPTSTTVSQLEQRLKTPRNQKHSLTG